MEAGTKKGIVAFRRSAHSFDFCCLVGH